MKRLLASLIGLTLWSSLALGASTVNPNVPATNAPLSSAPIRSNFGAAYNDINNLLTMFAGTTAPTAPSVGQFWRDTTSSSQPIKQWDGAQWVLWGTLNTSAHTFVVSSAAVAIVVGTTPITSGTTTRILYDNAGVVGEYTITGTGTVVAMQTSPAFVTPALGVATATSVAIGGCTLSANAFCVTGTAAISSTLTSAAHAITSASSAALTAGLNGSTNPALQVDASTASSATGLKVKSAAAAGGLALSVISSGTDENLAVDAKGAGTVTVGGTSTGAIVLTRATTMSAALTYGGVTLANSVTGTGSMVLATAPSVSSLTVTTAFTATGLVTNADLVNAATTVNGQTCTLGSTCTITATAASVTVGTTLVASGTTTRVLYNNAGTLGEYTISGSGTIVAMATAPSLTAVAGLGLRDTSAAFDMTIAATSSTALTAGRTLTIDVKNVAHTLALGSTANTITFPNLASFTVLTSGDTGSVTSTILANSLSLVTPNVNVATGTSLALSGCTIGSDKFCVTGTSTLTGATVVSAASFGLSGNISSAAWTTSGVRYKNVAATLTDTSSSGTVATAYTDVWGGNTIAASSSTTFTNYYGSFFKVPVVGSNVTFTNVYALGADSLNATTIALNGSNLAGANPSATAGPTAVNGSAVTYMRSDAAPAIQKASSSVFGIVEVDGTTITAVGGVITASGASATAITVGTTNVVSGTNTRILYNNSGVLGEYTLTGTGTVVVMATSPTIATPTITTSAVIPIIGPPSNSTTAVKITKADLSTAVMTFDTTNARVGINKTPGAFDLDVNGAVNIGGATTLGGALTYGGVALSNAVTGTGNMVLSANSTLSGTTNYGTLSGTTFSATTVTINGASGLSLTSMNTNTGIGYLCWNNPIVNYGSAACNVSDERVKIVNSSLTPASALAGIMSLKPVYFRWKDKTRNVKEGQQLGLTAQNLRSAFPELVTVNDGESDIVLDNGTTQVVKNTLAASYAQITAPLIGAVQALKAENDALSARVKTLEAR